MRLRAAWTGEDMRRLVELTRRYDCKKINWNKISKLMRKSAAECLVRYNVLKLQKENELNPPVTESVPSPEPCEYSQSCDSTYNFVAQICLE